MNQIKKMLPVALLFLSTSCATVFTGTRSTVTITSQPPGANIRIDGIDKGVTPATFKAKRKLSAQTVTLTKKGYQPRTFDFQQDFNAVSVINLLCVPCWAIDLLTGAVMNINPKQYNINLDKETSSN